jgi:hypothetical protein
MMIASSICSRSWRKSASILFTSITVLTFDSGLALGAITVRLVPFSEQESFPQSPYKLFVTHFNGVFKYIVPKSEQHFSPAPLNQRFGVRAYQQIISASAASNGNKKAILPIL